MNSDDDYRERWSDEQSCDTRKKNKIFVFKEAGVSRFNDSFVDEDDDQVDGFESRQ